MLLSLLLACPPEKEAEAGPAFGMILKDDGQLYAGTARIEITPEIIETYYDANGNNSFDGCYTDPAASREACNGETYDDVDGDGHFDGVWIAGFQSQRAASGVHDPLYVTAVVMSLNGEYVAMVGVDAIGVLENRIRDAADLVEAEGFDRDRLIVSSSHAHSGADTVGIWGLDEALITGVDPEYTASITAAIYDTVESAASTMVPVSPAVGIAHMDDPIFNGEPFGGTNPDPSIEAGMDDIRDPIIAAGDILSIALDGENGRVATIVEASGHPEVSGSGHSLLSADYPGTMRNWIEGTDGGTTLFVSGSLGGMQSASGAPIPVLDAAGNRVTDENGVQEYDAGENWDVVEDWGIHVGQAAQRAATDTQAWDKISIKKATYLIPVDNISFKLAFQVGLLDTPVEYVNQTTDCPGYGADPDNFGCLPGSSYILQLGPVTFGSVPGELFPELFWGVPDEPAMTDASLRSDDRRWVQVDKDCDSIDWGAVCVDEETVSATEDCDGPEGTACDGVCDCLHSHVAPYRISDNYDTPIVDLLPGTYKAPLGITNAYCGYIVPNPDFNTYATVLTEDGDHYEETNSCTSSFGELVLGAFTEMAQ